MASCGYGTGCYGTMVGIGTTGGFSIVLASSPWLVARVLAYLRIATVAARIAAAVHACIVWLVRCVPNTRYVVCIREEWRRVAMVQVATGPW